MDAYIPISLKRICTKTLADVERGILTKDQAEEIIKQRCRYSSKTREEIVAELTRKYDPESVRAFEFFRLI